VRFLCFFLTATGALLQEVLVLVLDGVDRDGGDVAAAGGIDWMSTLVPLLLPPLWEVEYARACDALGEFTARA
jgi:hypothetical protein